MWWWGGVGEEEVGVWGYALGGCEVMGGGGLCCVGFAFFFVVKRLALLIVLCSVFFLHGELEAGGVGWCGGWVSVSGGGVEVVVVVVARSATDVLSAVSFCCIVSILVKMVSEKVLNEVCMSVRRV